MSRGDTGGRSALWTESALDAFWERELGFPEHSFSVKYGPGLVAMLRRHICAGDDVLDYGCGPGRLSALLCSDVGANVWATDRLAGAVEAANRLNAAHPTFRGALAVGEFEGVTGRFDALVAVELLEHLPDDELDAFFGTAHRLLRAGGLLIVTTPNRERLEVKDVLCPSCGAVFHRWQHLRSIDAGRLRSWGTAAGFGVKEIVETDFGDRVPRFPGAARRWKGRIREPGARGRARPHLVGVFARSPADR
ncbi:methyltransferase domain-containing protein [Actinomadura sp. LD22]|uniref:Methyltransferase domain-containing protein n=1 Tax=Actinomadura physcomitrii TaxID=2650748 RepID=A0A6I4MSI8_9ACTN|nr:class I SAM-dependent methyltransferase [Actinomadura physcomitrii]MWA06807.1 methyltransferase domain-containing protein [Actinomadura physcomitrii]